MYCKKCGAKNEEEANFCTECGTSLGEIEEVTSNNTLSDNDKVHDSIFRKALKLSAINKPKGALYGMFGLQIALIVIFMLIVFLSIAGSVAAGGFNAGSVFAFVGLIFIFIIAYFIFTIIISVGMMKASLRISRDENVTFGSAFKGIFQNFNQSLKAIAAMFLYSVGMGILAWIPFIGGIAALILQIYLLPVLVVFIFMALDDKYKDMSMTDMFHKALDLVKSHRVEFYGLLLSFIGWMILAIFTFGLLYIWLMPYMLVSMSNWYLALNGDANYNEGEKGLSNIAIIGIAAASYFAFIFLAIVSVIMYIVTSDIKTDDLEKGINDFTENIIEEDYDYNDIKDSLKDGKVINMSGINVYVPSDYTESTMASYDKIYKSPYGETYIGTNNQDYSGSRDEFVQTLLAQYATMGFKCGTEETRQINGNEWVNFECDYNSNTTIYLYITQKNNKLYYLIVTDAGDLNDSKKLLGNIENNLNLAY